MTMTAEYRAVRLTFWQSREMRQLGLDAQMLMLYLTTNPHSNPLGLYYLPRALLTHELLMPADRLDVALTACRTAGLVDLDEDADMVWVPAMAAEQIADTLKPSDNRVAWLWRMLRALPATRFKAAFIARYGDVFHCPASVREEAPADPSKGLQKPLPEGEGEGLPRPYEAPSEGPCTVLVPVPVLVSVPVPEPQPVVLPTGPVAAAAREVDAAARLARLPERAAPVAVASVRATSIIRPRRKDAAWEGARLYVPQRAHSDFIGFLGGDPAAAERQLLEWYPTVEADWLDPGKQPGANMFEFWTARYNERWPKTAGAPVRRTGEPAYRTVAPVVPRVVAGVGR